MIELKENVIIVGYLTFLGMNYGEDILIDKGHEILFSGEINDIKEDLIKDFIESKTERHIFGGYWETYPNFKRNPIQYEFPSALKSIQHALSDYKYCIIYRKYV